MENGAVARVEAEAVGLLIGVRTKVGGLAAMSK